MASVVLVLSTGIEEVDKVDAGVRYADQDVGSVWFER